jgi:hypothetical protein
MADTLSSTAKALLDAVAIHLSQRATDQTLDLEFLEDEFDVGSIVGFLAGKVELHTDGELTVRPADPIFFGSDEDGDEVCRLVVCPASTPLGIVTELTDAMTLYTVAPDDEEAFDIVPHPSAEELAKRRIKREGSPRRKAQLSEGEKEAKDVLKALHREIVSELEARDEAEEGDESTADARIHLEGGDLDCLAAACDALGMSLPTMIGRVLED